MVATDVYKIAKALSKKEFIRLSDMLRNDVNQTQIKPNKNKTPDYTFNDALRYLLENHIKEK